MNNLFTIKAIKAGTLTLPKDSLAGGAVDADLMIEFPFTCFLLRNGEENILVDTGMKQSYLDQMAIGECHPTGSTQHLLDGLAEEGLAPADITSVIYTHLHYDHCANGDLFTDVPNYVQKREYDNMKNPYDFQTARMDYFPDTAEWIAKVNNLILVNGETSAFFEAFRKLSHAQTYFFSKMIPESVRPLFEKSAEAPFAIKILGSGGGGYMLLMTDDAAEASKYLEGFEVMWV